MAIEVFSVATDTLNGAVNVHKLNLYILGAGLPLAYINCAGDVLEIHTSRDLTVEEDATLTALVAAHDGQKIPTPVNHMAVSIRPDELAITNEDWPTTVSDQAGLIGCVTSKPDFFGSVAAMLGQVLGAKKVVSGGGGELPQVRVVQRNLNTGVEAVVLGPVTIAASADFAVLNLTSATNQLGTSYNEFFVQARRNGATEFRVRGVTCAVIELT